MSKLGINAHHNPVSSASTGSDIHEGGAFTADFGGIVIGDGSTSGGGSGATAWVGNLVQNVIVAAIAGLAVKYVWSKIK